MYDPELTNYLTMIATIGLATFWAVCYMYGVVSDKVEPFVFSDKFELGYIDDDEPVMATSQPDPPRAKTRSKKKKKKLRTIEDLNKRLNDTEKKNRRLEAEYYRETITPKEKSKPSPKPAPKPKIDEQLARDCSDALIGFGEGKRKAKQAGPDGEETASKRQKLETMTELNKKLRRELTGTLRAIAGDPELLDKLKYNTILATSIACKHLISPAARTWIADLAAEKDKKNDKKGLIEKMGPEFKKIIALRTAKDSESEEDSSESENESEDEDLNDIDA